MSTTRPLQVLLAVFDKAVSMTLVEHLQKRGYAGLVADTLPRVEAALKDDVPDLVIVELGKEAVPLERIRELVPRGPLVALAAPNPDLFFRAAKAGVDAVIALPLDPLEYMAKLEAVCAPLQMRLQAQASASSAEAVAQNGMAGDGLSELAAGAARAGHAEAIHVPSLFATSEDMAEVRDLIEKVAPTSATVLIRGESGVGKELAARLVHSQSHRGSRAFVKVNCAAIPNDLLESELFGYEAGAFTGAVKAKPGKFELADGGTIFLDEIGEMHPLLQAKLLHVLQDGEFARLGAKRDVAVDVRVICATNKPLDVLVANGQFREDLYYRINVVTVSLPPLRARRREIPVLVNYFVRRFAAVYVKPVVPVEPDAMETLMRYDWPGNIRELENLCKRYVIVGGIASILRELEQKQELRGVVRVLEGVPERAAPERGKVESLSAGTAAGVDQPSLLEIGRRAAWAAERAAIERMLRETRWNRREAARRLQISYKALLNKIHQMETEPEEQEAVGI